MKHGPRAVSTIRAVAVVLAGVAFGACGGPATTSPMAPSPTTVSTPAPAPTPPQNPTAAPATARYMVTFEATWSQATHPSDFPGDAHFSGLVGASHADGVTFWRVGSSATAGIQNMAERGGKAQLLSEVGAAIAAGTAEFALSGDGLARSPGIVALEFTVSQAFSLVTLVSMVAPSPDWFVGVHDLPLFVEGAWRDEVIMDLLPYDAGTDSGATFAAPDLETRPRGLIARITSFPFLNAGSVPPLGTFRFTKLTDR